MHDLLAIFSACSPARRTRVRRWRAHGPTRSGDGRVRRRGPLVLLAALVAWQLALAGHTAWLAAHAARVAARADAVGRAPAAAARSALPAALERDLGVRRLGAGGVRVSVRVPLLLRRWQSPVGDLGHRLAGEVAVSERGQADVEFLGALPALLVVALIALQLLAVGYASVLAGGAAEAGALALAAGADPRAGAREALPGWSRARAEVAVSGGRVVIRLRPPALLDALARRLKVRAAAEVELP